VAAESNFSGISFSFWGTGTWTQSLYLEPLYQPFFCDAFFLIEGLTNYLPGLAFWATILLITACILNSCDYRRELPAPGLPHISLFYFCTHCSYK
jgi:hypothetical protein